MSNVLKTIAITTLGCKVNQCDAAAITHGLCEKGYTLVPFSSEAACYIINTCVVTSSTESQSRQLIRRALKRSESAPVIVTGCYAQKNAEQLQAISSRVRVAGNTEKDDLPCLIDALLQGKQALFTVSDISCQQIFTTPGTDTFAGRTRAFLKIQDGCNNRCAYCIVPTVRGPSRSLPHEQVIGRMRALAANSYREIVLTGIHLGAWGLDLHPKGGLCELLSCCVHDKVLQGLRLRLSSIEPNEWTDELIGLMADSKNLCAHVHIPLQSGDAAILKSMGRMYSPDFFTDLVMRLVHHIPDINIGIDVIAGLPGETDASFTKTLSLIESLPAGYLHVFSYSRRPGTAAAQMPAQVAPTIIRKRMQKLRQLSDQKRHSFYARSAGASLEVLVEGRRDRISGLLRGITRNYIPVLFNGDDTLMGTLQVVQITRVEGLIVHGNLV
jgi:threonylcarbamoyladenosine tRNA methylthiotransferase MtaB